MPKFLTLNSKIIFMLLASVVMVLVLVGGVFSILITDLYEKSADNELEHGLELLLIDLKGKRARLVDSRRRMERNAAILASTNLIWSYQKIDDYQPLLFNPEKEELAQILQQEVRAAEFSFAAIYSENGEVIAFYDARTDVTGYISYLDSQPVAMQYLHHGGDARALNRIPPFLNGLDTHLKHQDQGIHFKMSAGRRDLIMESSTPLMKRTAGGVDQVIGWLRVAYRLDQKFVEGLAALSGLSISIHESPPVNGEGALIQDSEAFVINSRGFDYLRHHINEVIPEMTLDEDTLLHLHHIPGDQFFTGVTALSLEYAEPLRVLFALDKSQLFASIKAFQQAIFWVLLISGLLVIPAGILFTRRFVNRPIMEVVEFSEKVGYGDTTIEFKPDTIQEFNYLGENIQRMVDRLHESQDAIRESENQIRMLLDSAGEGIYGIDQHGLCTFANPRTLEILGYRSEEFIGQYIHPLIHHTRDDGRLYAQGDCPVYQSVQGDNAAHVEGELFWRKDGSSFVTEYRAYPIHSGDRVIGSVVTFSDITERKEIESSLELAKNIIENAHEGIMVTNLEGIIEQVNDAYIKISGFSREEAIGATPRIHQSGHHDLRFYAEMWKDIHSKGHWEGEIWDRRKSGEIFPKWLSINTVRDKSGNPIKYVGIFSDISTLKETERELENLAYYDALTKLPNRVLFRDRLKQGIFAASRDGHKLALLLIDLDRFKYVNDTLGHDAGDELLEIVAGRLQTFVRETDTVARLGGDEFIIILSEINHPEDASIIAQKIIDNLKTPIMVKGRRVNIGASIGIATYPTDGDESDLLVKHADLALYKAKDSGRNRYHYFSEELQTAIFDHIAMEDEMLKGIDGDQFTLHYQPKIHLDSGRVTGMEALIRWNHPERGFVRPDHFIPFAEESGLIIPMGLWIFKTACRQLAEFNAGLDEPLKLAINLSAGQFKQRGLVYTLKAIMDRNNIRPEHIELEITESSVMGDVDEAIATMNKFRDLGLQLAIDDFGTGYSSLSYLKRFPINTLKIDQSFVRDLTVDSDDAAIVNAIISMAKSLKLGVVAEGVETQEQLDFLKANGCGNVQGYLFSKPLPANEFHQYIRDNLG